MKCVFYVLTFESRPQNRASYIEFIHSPTIALQVIKTIRDIRRYGLSDAMHAIGADRPNDAAQTKEPHTPQFGIL